MITLTLPMAHQHKRLKYLQHFRIAVLEREQLLPDALTTGDDSWLLPEKNSEAGEYTRQQIQAPP